MLKLLRHLWTNEDGFFGIGQGPTKEEKQQYGELGSLANFATSRGEADISAADDFWKAILSGDPTKMARVLGPEISGINKRAQEQKKTASEFGTRSGGTAAFEAMAGDTTRSEIDQLYSSLVGHAAGALGASGQSLLAAGAYAHEGAFEEAATIQHQKAAKMNDLFKSIMNVATAFLPGPKGAKGPTPDFVPGEGGGFSYGDPTLGTGIGGGMPT